jgi:hypothetical protein
VIQHQRRFLAHVPFGRQHCVLTQAFERTDSLVAVDYQVPPHLAGQRYHHDRQLLPLLGKGRKEATLTIWLAYS